MARKVSASEKKPENNTKRKRKRKTAVRRKAAHLALSGENGPRPTRKKTPEKRRKLSTVNNKEKYKKNKHKNCSRRTGWANVGGNPPR